MNDDNQISMANLQGGLGDEINLKRSLELRNGVPLRSPTNFHKSTNAISLHLYKVSLILSCFNSSSDLFIM